MLSMTCAAQTSNKIVGKWVAYKKDWKNGETGENVTINNKPFPIDLTIQFNEDGTALESQSNLVADYVISDTTLILGNRQYIIETLENNCLVIRAYEELNPDNPRAVRLHFKRD